MGQAKSNQLKYENNLLKQRLNAYEVAYPEDRLCKSCIYRSIIDNKSKCISKATQIGILDEEVYPYFSCSEWRRK